MLEILMYFADKVSRTMIERVISHFQLFFTALPPCYAADEHLFLNKLFQSKNPTILL